MGQVETDQAANLPTNLEAGDTGAVDGYVMALKYHLHEASKIVEYLTKKTPLIYKDKELEGRV